MENSRLEKIIGFETERGSTYKYQDKKVIRNKFNGKKDEWNLNVFIPSYNQLNKEIKSKLKELYNIENRYQYEQFLSDLVYDRSQYKSHIYSFENGKYNLIKSDEEAKGKDIYFLALYRNSLKQAPKAAFIVQVEKQPKEGYLPYQENHLMKDGYYKFHLGDSVSKILGY